MKVKKVMNVVVGDKLWKKCNFYRSKFMMPRKGWCMVGTPDDDVKVCVAVLTLIYDHPQVQSLKPRCRSKIY